MKPTEGEIIFKGRNISGAQQHAIAKQGMGIKNQVPTVMDGLSVDENLWLAARSALDTDDARERADGIKRQLGLQPASDRLVGELAHGQRQWWKLAWSSPAIPR